MVSPVGKPIGSVCVTNMTTDKSNSEKPTWMKFQEEYGQGSYYGQDRLNIGPSFGTTTNGYEVWYTNQESDGCRDVFHHQLLVISDGADPSKVFSEDYHVHHKNGVKWDNRPKNLELLSESEHLRKHGLQREMKRDDGGEYTERVR